ncbi:MAG: hypothetical protein AAF591_10310 [Verrucomicrobiota bacterium]
MKGKLLLILTVVIGAVLAACEQHHWEDTQELFHGHGDHGDGGHGDHGDHDDHGDEHHGGEAHAKEHGGEAEEKSSGAKKKAKTE